MAYADAHGEWSGDMSLEKNKVFRGWDSNGLCPEGKCDRDIVNKA